MTCIIVFLKKKSYTGTTYFIILTLCCLQINIY